MGNGKRTVYISYLIDWSYFVCEDDYLPQKHFILIFSNELVLICNSDHWMFVEKLMKNVQYLNGSCCLQQPALFCTTNPKLLKWKSYSRVKTIFLSYLSLSHTLFLSLSLSLSLSGTLRQFSNSKLSWEKEMKLLLFLIEILCNGNRHNTNNLNDSF